MRPAVLQSCRMRRGRTLSLVPRPSRCTTSTCWNYTSRHPKVGLLEPLGADGCKSCANHEDSVEYSAAHEESLTTDLFAVSESVSLHNPTDSTATVRVAVDQIGQDVVGNGGDVVDTLPDREATMVFTLQWDDRWLVTEIQAQLESR